MSFFRKSILKNETGFALFEALVSVVLLSMGLVVVAQVFLRSVDAHRALEKQVYPAQTLADELMKKMEIRARVGDLPKDFFESGEIEGFQYRIVTTPWSYHDRLQQVEVGVYWNSKGQTRHVSLTTLLPVYNREDVKR